MSTENLKDVEIVDSVRSLIREWPPEVRLELGAVLLRLQRGEFVGMPDMRSMPTIHKGVFEIRIRSKEGAYRTFHICLRERGIVVFHAFEKKSRATPQNEIETARLRLAKFLRENL